MEQQDNFQADCEEKNTYKVSKLESQLAQCDQIIKRQSANMAQLVTAAQSLKDKLRTQDESTREDHQQTSVRILETQQKCEETLALKDEEVQKITQELDELKRYTDHIEIRYKEVSEAEEQANRKVLTLLDEVQNLTQENQELIKTTNQVSIDTSEGT